MSFYRVLVACRRTLTLVKTSQFTSLAMTPARSIPPTMIQHGNARGGGGKGLQAAFHGLDSDRSKKQKRRKDKRRRRRGGYYGLEREKERQDKAGRKRMYEKGRQGRGGTHENEWERGGRLVGWTPLLFPWSGRTQSHTSSCSHTALPSNIRHIPLLLTQGSQRELEGHDEIGVKVNLKARDEVHQTMGCLVEHGPLSPHQSGISNVSP